METDPNNLSPVDREALERALATAANDLAQREQIEAMLRRTAGTKPQPTPPFRAKSTH